MAENRRNAVLKKNRKATKNRALTLERRNTLMITGCVWKGVSMNLTFTNSYNAKFSEWHLFCVEMLYSINWRYKQWKSENSYLATGRQDDFYICYELRVGVVLRTVHICHSQMVPQRTRRQTVNLWSCRQAVLRGVNRALRTTEWWTQARQRCHLSK